MNRLVIKIFFLHFFVFEQLVFSQTNFFDNAFIEPRIHYGFMVPHTDYIKFLSTKHFPSYELNFGKQALGKYYWQQQYNNPQSGIIYFYSYLGNERLGNCHGLLYYINWSLWRKQHHWFAFRFATGLGYLSKTYHYLDNHKNIMISSHLNAAFNLMFNYQVRCSKKIYSTFGVGLTHFSNGAYKAPNLGVNIGSASVGILYRFRDIPISYDKIQKPEYDKHLNIKVFGAFGIKEIVPPLGKKYVAYSVYSDFLKPYSFRYKAGLGLDLFYNTSHAEFMRRRNRSFKDYELLKPGVHATHEMLISKLSFIFQTGFYLYAKENSDGKIYSRLGLQYPVYKNLLLNLSLKSHFAKADYIEYGIGYKFR